MNHRTWAEINLDNISHNYRLLKARLSEDTRFLGVVKADGYGHGAVKIAEQLRAEGCRYFAVSCVDEASKLRLGGISEPILILGYTSPELTGKLIELDITQSVMDCGMAEAFSQRASLLNKKLKIHIKADTGAGRFGFTCHHGQNPAGEIARIMKLPGLHTEGLFTHFAVSELLSDPFTEMQFQNFKNLVDEVERKSGQEIEIKHCANSGAVINYDYTYCNMVRPGIALYGLDPGGDAVGIGLRPAMSLKTRVYQIKDIDADYSVSYGRTYIAPSRRRIAVIPVGYADGLHRVLSGNMDVLVRGERAAQIGRICMDICMVDVTGIKNISVGDVVTIFGRDGDKCISVDELAEKAGTISYELLCAVSSRVPRVYLKNGVTT